MSEYSISGLCRHFMQYTDGSKVRVVVVQDQNGERTESEEIKRLKKDIERFRAILQSRATRYSKNKEAEKLEAINDICFEDCFPEDKYPDYKRERDEAVDLLMKIDNVVDFHGIKQSLLGMKITSFRASLTNQEALK